MKKVKLILVLFGVLLIKACSDLEIADPNNISADGYFSNQEEIESSSGSYFDK